MVKIKNKAKPSDKPYKKRGREMRKIVSWLLTMIITISIPIKGYSRVLGFYKLTGESISVTLQDTGKNEPKNSEKNYCLELLKRFESIISTKNYDLLTKEEKRIVDEFFLAFPQTNFCTSRLWNNFVNKANFDTNDVSTTSLSIFIAPWVRPVGNNPPLDISPVIDSIVPECSGSTDFTEKIKCVLNSESYIYQEAISLPVITSFLVKISNPDKVNVFVYKGRYSPVKEESFKQKFERLEKSLENKPVCVYDSDSKIICPFLHLEKNFDYLAYGNTYVFLPFSIHCILSSTDSTGSSTDSLKEKCTSAVSKLTGTDFNKPFSRTSDKIEEAKKRVSETEKKLRESEQISTKDYCFARAKMVNTDKLFFYFIKKPKEKECIEEITKTYYEQIRTQYMWLKKELKPRGYID